MADLSCALSTSRTPIGYRKRKEPRVSAAIVPLNYPNKIKGKASPNKNIDEQASQGHRKCVL
jgi:hypothetical protein